MVLRARGSAKRRFTPRRLDKGIGGPLSEYLEMDDNEKFVGIRKWIHVDNAERTFSPDFDGRVKQAMTRIRERIIAKNRERMEVIVPQLISYYPQQGNSLNKTSPYTTSELETLNEVKFLHGLVNDTTRSHVIVDGVRCSLNKLRALCTDFSGNMSSGIKESRANESQTEATVTFASVGCQTSLDTDTVDSLSTNTTRSKQITPQSLMSLPLTVTPRPLMSLSATHPPLMSLPITAQPLMSVPATPQPLMSVPAIPQSLTVTSLPVTETPTTQAQARNSTQLQERESMEVDEPLQTSGTGADGKSKTPHVQTVPPLPQLSRNPQSSDGLLSLPTLPVPVVTANAANPTFWSNYTSQGNNGQQQIPDFGFGSTGEAVNTVEAKYQQAKQWRPRNTEQAALFEQAKTDMYQVLLVNKGCQIRRLIREFLWTVQEPLILNSFGIPNIQTFMVQMHNCDMIILKSERNTGNLFAYAKTASGDFEHVAHIAELVTEQRNSHGTNSNADMHYECDIRELFKDNQSRTYDAWSTYYGSSTDRNWRGTTAQPSIYWSQNPYFVNYNGYYGSAHQNQSMQYQQAIMAQYRQHALAQNAQTQYLNSLSYGIYQYNCSVNRGTGNGCGRR